jgi:hypothetical protein
MTSKLVLPELNSMTAFLPLLLLGNHLRADRDAGQVLELLVILGKQIAARTLDQEDFDLLAFELLPVEGALRLRG